MWTNENERERESVEFEKKNIRSGKPHTIIFHWRFSYSSHPPNSSFLITSLHNWSDELKQREIYGWHQIQRNGKSTNESERVENTF